MQMLPKPPSTKGPAEFFTGDVWLDVIYRGNGPSRIRMNAVHFTPCARTAWHSHALGQTLHVTEGTGLVVTRDGTVIVMRPGDTVWTPPGEEHWHGAAENPMTHLACWEGDEIAWLEHVTDDEYHRAAGQ